MFPRQVVGWRLGSGALAAALVWPVAADHGPALHQTTDRIPQIELKAPGVFDDRARPAVAENALRYHHKTLSRLRAARVDEPEDTTRKQPKPNEQRGCCPATRPDPE